MKLNGSDFIKVAASPRTHFAKASSIEIQIWVLNLFTKITVMSNLFQLAHRVKK